MDDRKLRGSSEEELRNVIRIVKTINNNIKIEFGLEKYVRVFLKKWEGSQKTTCRKHSGK